MVSGGQVRSDASSLSTYGSNYSSLVEGLSGSWKGNSYDQLNSQSQMVLSDFVTTIKGQMEAYATACDLYEDYINNKNNLSIAQGNYNQAVANKDASAANTFSSQISQFNSQMSTLRSQIESNLAAAGSSKLEATRISVKDYASGRTISYGGASGVVQGAIDWALAIAADDSHGYSQKTRWGNPNYDCSSLVISAFESAGIPVKEAGAGYTGNMRSAFTRMGFEWIPGNPNVNDLQPGDILLSENSHTELYIGDGMNVGAHGDRDGANGDSGGGEISVTKYYSHPWDGVLRYVGYDSTQANV